MKEKLRLGRFVNLKRGYDLPARDRVDGPYPIISSSGITGKHNSAKVSGPGVVTGRYGTLGEVFFVEGEFWPLNTSLYVQDFKGNDARFIYYFLKTVLSENFNSAGAVPGVNRNVLHKLAIPEPPKEQKKVAAVLAAYDQLIQNNDDRIAILQAMAGEIYREWFVRMRFPGYESTEFTKGVPKGWSVRPISTFAKEVRSSVKREDLRDDELYVGLEHLPRKSIALGNHTTVASIDSNKLRFKERDILFCKIRPYLHKVVLAHVAGVCSTDAIVLRPTDSVHEAFLLYTVFSDTFIELATVASKGTKMPRADWAFLEKLELKVPTKELLEEFQEYFDGVFQQITNRLAANQLLKEVRPWLLRRLMSNKLSVDGLDIANPEILAKAGETDA